MPLRENRYLDTMPDTSGRPNLGDAQAALLERAALLPPNDKLLVDLAIRNRLTYRQLAQLMSAPSGTICRRLHRLLNRLNDPMVRRILERRCPLPDEYRQVAIEHMLQGRGVREIAQRHQLRPWQVRTMLEHVRGWHRGMSHLAPARLQHV